MARAIGSLLLVGRQGTSAPAAYICWLGRISKALLAPTTRKFRPRISSQHSAARLIVTALLSVPTTIHQSEMTLVSNMAGKTCAFNSATALWRVFMPFNLGVSGLHVTRIFVPSLVANAPQQQIRAASGSWWNSGKAGTWGSNTARTVPSPRSFRDPLDDLAKNLAPNGAFSRNPGRFENKDRPGPRVKTKLARLPRDAEIMQPYVHVLETQEVGSEERPSEPRSVKALLAAMDLKTHSLQVVQIPEPGTRGNPICRIVNKKEELLKQKLLKEREKQQKVATREKILELNWALAPHDVEHKMKHLQSFLAKGYRVLVVLLKKRGSKAPVKEKQANALVDRLMEAVAEVPGSQEWKKREGKMLATLKIFFQGKAQEKAEQDGQEQVSKKQKKMMKALQRSEADAEESDA